MWAKLNSWTTILWNSKWKQDIVKWVLNRHRVKLSFDNNCIDTQVQSVTAVYYNRLSCSIDCYQGWRRRSRLDDNFIIFNVVAIWITNEIEWNCDRCVIKYITLTGWVCQRLIYLKSSWITILVDCNNKVRCRRNRGFCSKSLKYTFSLWSNWIYLICFKVKDE